MKWICRLILIATLSLSSCRQAGQLTQAPPAADWMTVTPTSLASPSPTPTESTSLILVSAGQSIQASCVDAASAGATCQVSSGTYSETVTINKSLSLVCSGTCLVKGGITLSANNITLRGFEVTGRGVTVKGQYNTVENNYVHDLTTVTNGGISLYNQPASHHITIRNNRIKSAYNSCIYIAGSNHLIEGNDCSFTKQPTDGDADCIRAFGYNQTIRHNSCHDIAYGAAGYNPAVGDYIDNAHIDGVQTWNFTGQGGALRDSLIEYNNIDLPSQGTQATAKGFQLAGVTGGSQSIDLTQPYPCRNITIRYNLVHFNLLGIFRYCEDMTVVNNTFIGDEIDTAAGFHILNSRGTNRFQYNIFCCKLKDAAFTPYDTESETSLVGGYNNIYQTNGVPVGKPWPGDLWDVDPQFVDPAARDYRLMSGSPACGMGAFPCE